jgi:hypothetical protein
MIIHSVLVAFPKKAGANKKLYSHQKPGVRIIARSQPKDAKPIMRERKLRRVVN